MIFDDLARVAGGAMNVFSSLREQVTGDIKARVEDMAASMDLVPREDFDRLQDRVDALQKQIDALTGKTPKPAAAKAAPKDTKTAAKKTAAKKTTKKTGKR